MAAIVSFVGRHNSGKTTLIAAVIKQLALKGVKTAVIKHAPHGLNIPQQTDSGILFAAGAHKVMAAAPGVSLVYKRIDQETNLAHIYAQISSDVDLVITEGFKHEDTPKIEVLRQQIDSQKMQLTNIIARVANFPLTDVVPVFSFTQVEELAAFIIAEFNLDATS